jgi:hypothetical protein
MCLELGQRGAGGRVADIGGFCRTDSDCTLIRDEGCGTDCWIAAVPRGSEAVVEAGFAAIRDSVCADYVQAGCALLQGPFSGCAHTIVEPRCVDSMCTWCSSSGELGNNTCEQLALCEQCPLPEIHWGPIGVEPGEAHSLLQCRAFRSLSPELVCEATLECSRRPFAAGYTASDLLARLSEPDVQEALQRHAYFGLRSPDAVGVQLTVGTGTLTVSAGRCKGDPGCESPPDVITYLRDMLNGIVIQQRDRCR